MSHTSTALHTRALLANHPHVLHHPYLRSSLRPHFTSCYQLCAPPPATGRIHRASRGAVAAFRPRPVRFYTDPGPNPAASHLLGDGGRQSRHRRARRLPSCRACTSSSCASSHTCAHMVAWRAMPCRAPLTAPSAVCRRSGSATAASIATSTASAVASASFTALLYQRPRRRHRRYHHCHYLRQRHRRRRRRCRCRRRRGRRHHHRCCRRRRNHRRHPPPPPPPWSPRPWRRRRARGAATRPLWRTETVGWGVERGK